MANWLTGWTKICACDNGDSAPPLIVLLAGDALRRERLQGEDYHEWRWAMCEADEPAPAQPGAGTASVNAAQRALQKPFSMKRV